MHKVDKIVVSTWELKQVAVNNIVDSFSVCSPSVAVVPNIVDNVLLLTWLITMNWDAIGAMGEVLGALAVIATLVYLARQIRESNKLAKSTSARDVMNGFGETNALMTQPSLAAAFAKMAENKDNATPEQKVQIRQFCLAVVNVYLQAETSYKHGNLDDRNYSAVKMDINPLLKQYPGLAEYFEVILEDYPVTGEWEVMQGIRDALDAMGLEQTKPSC